MIQDWRDIGATRKGLPASEGDANTRVAILGSCDGLSFLFFVSTEVLTRGPEAPTSGITRSNVSIADEEFRRFSMMQRCAAQWRRFGASGRARDFSCIVILNHFQ